MDSLEFITLFSDIRNGIIIGSLICFVPPRPTEAPIKEVFLDTPESRKQAIREVALSITELGDEISDEAVLEELKRRGMKIDLINPTATISTILNGFKPQFEKVQGKRGLFRRQR